MSSELLYKAAVYNNLFVGILSGIYIVVYITSVYALLIKPGFTSSPFRMSMFGITTFLFALAIIALVLQTTLFQKANLISNSYIIYSYVWATITCVTHILCDIICAWRTVVIWNRDKHIITILVVFIFGTIATAGYALATGYGPVLSLSSNEAWHLTFGKLNLIMIIPTLATNLLSTGLIAWKAWQRRITVGKHLREGRRFVRVDRVFALLIESGLIYCCIWISYWISMLGVLPFPGFTVIVLVSGLYPTLIIILVSMHLSPVDHYSAHSA